MMVFSQMMRDTLTLIKQDGSRQEGIKGSVQKNRIYIHNGDISIEEGDEIIRAMPGGKNEEYIVIEPGFYQGLGSIPAGYQMDVKRKSSFSNSTEKNQPQSVTNTYNLFGNNSRVNHQSTDNSYNYTGSTESVKEILQLIEAAREQIKSTAVDKSEVQTANQSLEIIESQIKTSEPSKPIIKTLLNALPDVVKAVPAVVSLIESFQ
ncbi:hypothetical protein AB6859_23900 [Rahnella inusitata]|uniref:hypothetical protein n=1 Tax=Rahnella inusitata TaxID=58169 RepID=UPI0039BDE72B